VAKIYYHETKNSFITRISGFYKADGAVGRMLEGILSGLLL
jgi:hypothetical protein